MAEGAFVIPEWMTSEQEQSVRKLYARNADGSSTLLDFFGRVHPCVGGYCGIQWCGMFVGIEKDGYSHT